MAVNTSQFLAVKVDKYEISTFNQKLMSLFNKMLFKVEGVIQRSKTVKGAEEGRQVTALKIPFFEKHIISTEGCWSDGDAVLGPAKTSRRQQGQRRQGGDQCRAATGGRQAYNLLIYSASF